MDLENYRQNQQKSVRDQLKFFSNSCYCFHGSLSPRMRSILIALPLYVNGSHAGIRVYLKRLQSNPGRPT